MNRIEHQWFGNSLALSDWGDIWLNESFATYSQALWQEYKRGENALDNWIKNTYNTVIDSLDQLVPPGEPPADDLFNSGVYEWGALGLHALRLEIDDDAFFNTLQTYYSTYRDGNVTPDDLLAVAEASSGEELDQFFQDWFYSETVPDIPQLGLFSGLTGDEILYGDSERDAIFGRDGNDIIYGNSLSAALLGGDGDDSLYGGAEADDIRGGSGDDIIYAGGGADLINSGAGDDTVWLGSGAATITLSSGSGYDTIKGFELGMTQIQVSGLSDLSELSFADSSDGVQIQQADDLIAVVSWQTASSFSSNIGQIFVI